MAKTFGKVIAVISTLLILLSVTALTAFAASDYPGKIPSPGETEVSEEVDTATNEDPEMGTKFYIYIPPDPTANDYPNMADEGIAVQWFILGAIVSGLVYLGVTAYGKYDKETVVVA